MCVIIYRSIYIVGLTSLIRSFRDHGLALPVSPCLKVVLTLSKLEVEVFSS